MVYQNPNFYYTYTMPYNPFYVVPVGTSSHIPINSNQSNFQLLTQQLLVSGNIPTSSYTISSLVQQPTAPAEELSIKKII